MTTYLPPSLCDSCKRKRDGNYCDAYPEGIPVEIRINDVDHREPYTGDDGKQFLLDERLTPIYIGWLQDQGKR
jgi:hypothetical protein